MDKYILIVNLFELLAAIVGTYYIKQYRVDKATRYFVYFLWITVIVEIVGLLPTFIHFYEEFSFLKETFLARNKWLYNCFNIFSFIFYLWYFSWNLKRRTNKMILKLLAVVFLVSSIFILLFTDVFFKSTSYYTSITGSILLLLSVMLYFYEMLQSDEILNFNKSLIFYISIGTLVLYLAVTPLFIYDNYFKLAKSPEFVEIRRFIIRGANIFMYTCYIFGFLVCYKKNNSYQRNRFYS